MGKTARVVICGMKNTGKTCILEQAVFGNVTKDSIIYPTIEDSYIASVETDRGSKEKVMFYDTAGVEPMVSPTRELKQSYALEHQSSGNSCSAFARHYAQSADGYIFVYDTSRPETFDCIITLKKELDKNRERKEALMVIVGHHIKSASEVSSVLLESPVSKATHWSIREKIKHFEVNAYDRSTLYETFIYLASKLNPVQNKSAFPQLSMSEMNKYKYYISSESKFFQARGRDILPINSKEPGSFLLNSPHKLFGPSQDNESTVLSMKPLKMKKN